MGMKPEFEIVIGCDIPSMENRDIFIRLIQSRALRLDPEVKYDFTHFAGLKCALRWYGNIVDFGYIDNFYDSVKRYSDKYLGKWELFIKVKYIEKEGEI